MNLIQKLIKLLKPIYIDLEKVKALEKRGVILLFSYSPYTIKRGLNQNATRL